MAGAIFLKLRKIKGSEQLPIDRVPKDTHIAVVGVPESGKSSLVYRLIAEIMRQRGNVVEIENRGEAIRKIEDAEAKIKRIVRYGWMVNAAKPSPTGPELAIPLKVKIKSRSIFLPDHNLYVYDLPGKHVFDIINCHIANLDLGFLRYSHSMVILIDPTTFYFPDIRGGFTRQWIQDNVEVTTDCLSDPQHLLSGIDNAFQAAGADPNGLKYNFVLVKTDLGYIPPTVDLSDEISIREYLTDALGLEPFVHWASRGEAHFFAVSAVQKEPLANISPLLNALLLQAGIKS